MSARNINIPIIATIGLVCLGQLTFVQAREKYWIDQRQHMHWKSHDIEHETVGDYCKSVASNTSLVVDDIHGWEWSYRCSIASTNFTYYDAQNQSFVAATVGEYIPFTCDGLFCPQLPQPDCYHDPDICSEDEWCNIDVHERWGPWAYGENGTSFLDNDDGLCNNPEYYNSSDPEVQKTWDMFCQGERTHGPWVPARGRCVKYRQKDQSCKVQLETAKEFQNEFLVDDDGQVFDRDMICAPGLVCTGDLPIYPNTCVERRPKNICYQGPWWDSHLCPRENSTVESGLSKSEAITAILSAMLVFPGEILGASRCEYWYPEVGPKSAQAARSRKLIYNILATLWPAQLYGVAPTFDEVMRLLNGPEQLGNYDQCVADSKDNTTAIYTALAMAGGRASQPNQVWSIVHTVMHNMPSTGMTNKQVQASRALAIFLQQNFWCTDCRGFFAVGVLKEYGLPPQTNDPVLHAKWWWAGHNTASEHTAVTRGGHPWLYPHNDEAIAAVGGGNPFYMSYEDSERMWTLPEGFDETA